MSTNEQEREQASNQDAEIQQAVNERYGGVADRVMAAADRRKADSGAAGAAGAAESASGAGRVMAAADRRKADSGAAGAAGAAESASSSSSASGAGDAGRVLAASAAGGSVDAARSAGTSNPVSSESAGAASSSSAFGAGAGFTVEFIQSASQTASCCGPESASGESCGCGSAAEHDSHGTLEDHPESVGIGSRLYESGQISSLPEDAVAASLGCGNPVAIAELSAGERVLDLGSGGGIDCFLAGQQVGAEGEVWGLDMTPQMIRLARQNAAKVDAGNVNFRLGEIEDMPFEAGHFDAIISNCVINLSVDKPQVFREAFRVLKPGGRLRVSDIVWTRDVPAAERGDIEEWAGCVAGALPLGEYEDAIRSAGFTDVAAQYADNERGLASAYVSAVKPV